MKDTNMNGWIDLYIISYILSQWFGSISRRNNHPQGEGGHGGQVGLEAG